MYNQNAKNIQKSLNSYFAENQYCKNILPYAGVLLYVYVAIGIMGMFPLPLTISQIFGYLSAILYFLYFVGLVMCYAKNEMLPVFVVFVYQVISHIVSIIRGGIMFNNIVYIIIYGLIAYWAFRKCFQEEKYKWNTASSLSDQMYCPGCGKPVSGQSEFCGYCGTKIK